MITNLLEALLLGNLRPAAESMVSTVHCGLGKTNDQMKSLHIPAGGGAGAGARCPHAASGGYQPLHI